MLIRWFPQRQPGGILASKVGIASPYILAVRFGGSVHHALFPVAAEKPKHASDQPGRSSLAIGCQK
jgi:hypothetical protein